MGWIKLDRKILEHWIWEDKPYSKGQAWIDLLLLASHEDKIFISGAQKVEGKRGNVYKSILFLANRWGWSRKKVMGLLTTLQRDGMITQKRAKNSAIITIVNYEKYQGQGTTKDTTQTLVGPGKTQNQGTTKGTTEGQRKIQQRDNTREQKGTTEDTTPTLINSGKTQNWGQQKGQQRDNAREQNGQKTAHIQEYKKSTTYSKEEKNNNSGCAANVPPPGGMTEKEWDALKAKLRE